MRLIDADALKEAFYQKMKELLKFTTTPQISNEALSLLCGASLIAEAPTIEPIDFPSVNVQEVRHGKWLDVENDIDYYPFMCSECYETVINKTNYCPRCGARMEG